MTAIERSVRPARPARPAIDVRGLGVTIDGVAVLADVDLTVPEGTWLGVLGPNGAGKTTLVRALSGTVRYTGTVAIGADADADVGAARGDTGRGDRPSARARRLAVVPQAPVIPPGITVFEYVLLGRTPHQGLRLAASLDDRRRSLAVLQRLELERFAARDLATLSGGERQRVVLARALVSDAPVLVLDEPTAALDLGHQFGILELLAELQQERGLTIVTTLHDLAMAGQFGDRLAVLSEGRLVADGAPAEVLTPATIGRWWGVDATTTVDDAGRVDVTVRRRSAPARAAGHAARHATTPTSGLEGPRSGSVVARGEGFEPPAA
jgi:iron complex transport system ATP-binding protein